MSLGRFIKNYKPLPWLWKVPVARCLHVGKGGLPRHGCPESRRPAPADPSPGHRHPEQPPFRKKKQKALKKRYEINKTQGPLRLDQLPELTGRPGRNKHSLPKGSFPALGTNTRSDYPGWFIYLSRLLTWRLNAGTGIGVLPGVLLFEEIPGSLPFLFVIAGANLTSSVIGRTWLITLDLQCRRWPNSLQRTARLLFCGFIYSLY